MPTARHNIIDILAGFMGRAELTGKAQNIAHMQSQSVRRGGASPSCIITIGFASALGTRPRPPLPRLPSGANSARLLAMPGFLGLKKRHHTVAQGRRIMGLLNPNAVQEAASRAKCAVQNCGTWF